MTLIKYVVVPTNISLAKNILVRMILPSSSLVHGEKSKMFN
jgi:hypothetical protein